MISFSFIIIIILIISIVFLILILLISLYFQFIFYPSLLSIIILLLLYLFSLFFFICYFTSTSFLLHFSSFFSFFAIFLSFCASSECHYFQFYLNWSFKNPPRRTPRPSKLLAKLKSLKPFLLYYYNRSWDGQYYTLFLSALPCLSFNEPSYPEPHEGLQ